ncbi:DUF1462 family protein [Sporolactobacillus shoreae]|uniref:DUF1462 family protein n=1 Tax=Sporolactobacillus shoreae TaxID=1465501 RepID=A0A4Z0GKE0_9BACL|nr:DUF1462 family protein [Sporolactobacillus shoreae]TGA97260.1 DUF1462 family protein [Sporolactobacillus shoreae]
MELTIYGAEAVCASCAQAPPSKATAEWLEAALFRKFGNQVSVRYIDIDQPETEADRYFCDKIKSDAYFFPLLVSEEEVLGEGFISLKPVLLHLKKSGLAIKEAGAGEP